MNEELVRIYTKIIESEKLDQQQKKELLNEARKLLSPDENRWNFRFVIWTLALVALSVPILSLWKSIEIPQGLLSLSSTAVGALAGFLSLYVRRRTENLRTDSQLSSSALQADPSKPNG